MCQQCWVLLRNANPERAREGLILVMQHHAPQLKEFVRSFRLMDADYQIVLASSWQTLWTDRLTIRSADPMGWLISVARNEAMNIFRERARTPQFLDPDMAPEQFIDLRLGPDQIAADCEAACDADDPEGRAIQRLHELIDELDPMEQDILQARWYPVTTPWTQEIHDKYPGEFSTDVAIRVRCVRIEARLRERLEHEGLL